VRDREARHVRLDRLAHLDQLQRARVLGDGLRPLSRVIDEGAAADPARDQRHLLELAQRLAHGAARRAEVLGQVALGRQALAVRVRTLESLDAAGQRSPPRPRVVAAVSHPSSGTFPLHTNSTRRTNANQSRVLAKNWFE
jgi:hypothetical protein